MRIRMPVKVKGSSGNEVARNVLIESDHAGLCIQESPDRRGRRGARKELAASFPPLRLGCTHCRHRRTGYQVRLSVPPRTDSVRLSPSGHEWLSGTGSHSSQLLLLQRSDDCPPRRPGGAGRRPAIRHRAHPVEAFSIGGTAKDDARIGGRILFEISCERSSIQPGRLGRISRQPNKLLPSRLG